MLVSFCLNDYYMFIVLSPPLAHPPSALSDLQGAHSSSVLPRTTGAEAASHFGAEETGAREASAARTAR